MTQTVQSHSSELKRDVDNIGSILKQLTKKAEDSGELLNMGVTDSFAREIEKVRKAPLEAMLKTWESIESGVKDMTKNLVKSFIQTESDKLLRAVISSPEDTSIKVSLVLKDDSFENRSVFYEFAQDYESLSFSKRYPIIFSFVNKELSTKINVIEEIGL